MVGEVGAASGANDLGVAIHDHVFGVGVVKDLGGACHVVEVGLAVEEDLDVGVLEAELLDAGADLRGGAGKVGVDENVALGRGDEVAGKVAAANIVEMVGDLEGWERGGPVGVLLRGQGCGNGEGEDEAKQKAHGSCIPYAWAVVGCGVSKEATAGDVILRARGWELRARCPQVH
jgi:hypothetical protein